MAVTNNVTLCDACKRVVADSKCCCCKMDLCQHCVSDKIEVITNHRDMRSMEIMYPQSLCSQCKIKIREVAKGDSDKFFDEKFKEEVTEKVKLYIRDKLFIKSL